MERSYLYQLLCKASKANDRNENDDEVNTTLDNFLLNSAPLQTEPATFGGIAMPINAFANSNSVAADRSKTSSHSAKLQAGPMPCTVITNGKFHTNTSPLPVDTKKSTSKPAKKRTWKKPKDKPKRPLSAYNLFFQYQREKIIRGDYDENEIPTEDDVKATLAAGTAPGKKRRRHRASHGKMDFAHLARHIADKWKELDSSALTVFEAHASVEKGRYQRELDKWNQEQAVKKKKEKEIEASKQKQEREDDNDDSDTDLEIICREDFMTAFFKEPTIDSTFGFFDAHQQQQPFSFFPVNFSSAPYINCSNNDSVPNSANLFNLSMSEQWAPLATFPAPLAETAFTALQTPKFDLNQSWLLQQQDLTGMVQQLKSWENSTMFNSSGSLVQEGASFAGVSPAGAAPAAISLPAEDTKRSSNYNDDDDDSFSVLSGIQFEPSMRMDCMELLMEKEEHLAQNLPQSYTGINSGIDNAILDRQEGNHLDAANALPQLEELESALDEDFVLFLSKFAS